MNEFEERFSKIDNRKLLSILSEPSNYLPSAIEAAEQELLKRKISSIEIDNFNKQEVAKLKKAQERKAFYSKFKGPANAFGNEVFETISPISRVPQTVKRKINLIAIVFGCLAVYQVVREYGTIQFMLTDVQAKWDASMIRYFIPIVMLPIAVILFYVRRPIGWITMAIFFTYNSLSTISAAFLSWQYYRAQEDRNYALQGEENGLVDLLEIYSPTPPSVYCISALIFGATLWQIIGVDVRSQFDMSIRDSYLIVGTSVVLFTLVLWL